MKSPKDGMLRAVETSDGRGVDRSITLGQEYS